MRLALSCSILVLLGSLGTAVANPSGLCVNPAQTDPTKVVDTGCAIFNFAIQTGCELQPLQQICQSSVFDYTREAGQIAKYPGTWIYSKTGQHVPLLP